MTTTLILFTLSLSLSIRDKSVAVVPDKEHVLQSCSQQEKEDINNGIEYKLNTFLAIQLITVMEYTENK